MGKNVGVNCNLSLRKKETELQFAQRNRKKLQMIKNIDFNLIDVITLNQGQNTDNQSLDRVLSYASYLDREIHYILDFIVRNLKENKVEIAHPQGKKIKNITALVGAEENKAYFYDENTINVHLTFQYGEVFSLRGKPRQNKFLQMLKLMAKTIGEISFELEKSLLNAITEFENNGGKNSWVHQKKSIKGVGTAMLECQLTSTEFSLSLLIKNKKNEEIFRKIIAKTKPDIFVYNGLFDKIEFANDEIKILTKHLKEPIYILNINHLQDKNAGYFPILHNFTKIDTENHIIVEDYSKLNLRKNAQWWSDFKAQLEDLNATEPCPKME